MILRGAIPKPSTVISHIPLVSLPFSKNAEIRKEGKYCDRVHQEDLMVRL